jgi:hypothetical protein
MTFQFTICCCSVEDEDPGTLEKKVIDLHMHLHYSVPSGSLDLGNFFQYKYKNDKTLPLLAKQP